MMPVGIALVDRAARVVWTNLCGRRLLRRGDGIALRHDRLVTTSPKQSDALASLVQCAVGLAKAGQRRDPAAIAVSRSVGSVPLVIMVSPLEVRGRRHADGAPQAVIFISDPVGGLRTSRERLRQLFGLTRKEAELVALLAAGHGLGGAATQLGVTQHTARTYLKQAFEKTGARRQAELVRLALAAVTAGQMEA